MWVLGADGCVRFANSRGRRLVGADAEGSRLTQLWPAESRASLERAVAGAAENHEQRFRAFFRDDEGGGAYWETVVSPVRSAAGEVVELLAVSRDVTSTVETEGFLETVIQMLPAPLSVKDVHTRRYLLMNRAIEELIGVEQGEGLGRTIEELLPPERAANVNVADERVLRAGQMVRFEHTTAPSPGEEPRHFNFKVLATHDDAGPRHLVTIGDDVTERRAAAESLQTALEAAQQASQAKSAFIANMSHEIRTPLNGILAGADLLAGERLSDRGRELAVMIRASGRALEQLMSGILEIARAETGELSLQPAPFRLDEALDQALAEVRADAALKGLTVTLEIEPGADGLRLGDEARVRQALGCLLSNAVKFTERGAVRLRAEDVGEGRLRFTVSDTGIGFDPALTARLFERFFQADDSYTRRFEGSGLGLAICQELVGRMGGALGAEGRPGEGARFWFEIPLPAAPAGEAETPVLEPEDISSRPDLRILVADDHPTNRRVVQLMLGDLADIVSVEDGAQAVEAFAAARFDVVLMDMQMPVMDGLSAVREIRRLEAAGGLARTPIVMLTANALAEHRAASAQAGADLHLGKPITSDGLIAALDLALTQNELREAAPDAALYASFAGAAPGSKA
jgi:PAS domain S-box-containing protein